MCHCPCPCLSSGDKSIKQMVSDPKDDNYVRVSDFDKLSENLKKITDLTCPVGCQGEWGVVSVQSGFRHTKPQF